MCGDSGEVSDFGRRTEHKVVTSTGLCTNKKARCSRADDLHTQSLGYTLQENFKSGAPRGNRIKRGWQGTRVGRVFTETVESAQCLREEDPHPATQACFTSLVGASAGEVMQGSLRRHDSCFTRAG